MGMFHWCLWRIVVGDGDGSGDDNSGGWEYWVVFRIVHVLETAIGVEYLGGSNCGGASPGYGMDCCGRIVDGR